MEFRNEIIPQDIFQNFMNVTPKHLHNQKLNFQRISIHHSRILYAINNNNQTTIPISDACTIENGGIISNAVFNEITNNTDLNFVKSTCLKQWIRNSLVTCIPAAGAAARFFCDLQKLINSIEETVPELKKLINKNEIIINDKRRNQIIDYLNNFILSSFLEKTMNSKLYKNNNTIFDTVNFIKSQLFNKNTIIKSQHINNILVTYTISNFILENYQNIPKALLPATNENDTFLKLKIIEQFHLFHSLGNVLIVPPEMKNNFELEIQKIISNFTDQKYISNIDNNVNYKNYVNNWIVLEQGFDLSTIRFHIDGKPYLDSNGNISLVSAGHGELIHLFNDIADSFPEAECLHIRNIDNIIGTQETQQDALLNLSKVFKVVRQCLEYLRLQIQIIVENKNNLHKAKISDIEVFNILLYFSKLINNNSLHKELLNCYQQEQSISFLLIIKTLGQLFHWPLDEFQNYNITTWIQLLDKLENPLSVFGVVQKEKNDTGGGPVFVKLQDNSNIKLCLEMPHASENDCKNYFGDNGKVTHFNPVLVFFELRTHDISKNEKEKIGKKVNYAKLFDERFWLLTQREHMGNPVCYHETVLYELIGNSAVTNLLFIEVPRSLFHPHKSYADTIGKSRHSYGFDEIIS